MPEKMDILDKAKLEIVIARFDFKFVHELMTKMNWAWATRGGGMEIPDIELIRDTAYTLLEEAYKSGDCSTGGLLAEWRDEQFNLKFVAEESESYIDEEETKETVKEKEVEPEDPHQSDNAISLLGE